MSRVECVWETSVATILRLQAAKKESMGMKVSWNGDKIIEIQKKLQNPDNL